MDALIHNTVMKMGAGDLPAALSGLAWLGVYAGFRQSAPPWAKAPVAASRRRRVGILGQCLVHRTL